MTCEQWMAIQNNDKAYDGIFYHGLKTTKIVCRPSCPLRTRNIKIKNTVIFSSMEDALNQGYRPCKRCRPDLIEWEGNKAELAKSAKALIENTYRDEFSAKAIADELFTNHSYLSRTFKEITGYTMLQYHNYVRCHATLELLQRPELPISYISDVVGYHYPSHYTRIFRKFYDCTPSEYREKYLDQITSCSQ